MLQHSPNTYHHNLISFPSQSPHLISNCNRVCSVCSTMSWKTCILLYMSLAWGVSCEQRCPPASMVSPCLCTSNSSLTSLTCTDIDTPLVIEVIEKIPKWNLDHLLITDSVMQYIPSSTLKGSKFYSMEVKDSRFNTLFDSTPFDVNLESLVLRNVHVST